MKGKTFSVVFPEETVELLEKLAAHEHTTKANVVRRAIGLYDYLVTETNKGKDKSIQIVDPSTGDIDKEIVFTE